MIDDHHVMRSWSVFVRRSWSVFNISVLLAMRPQSDTNKKAGFKEPGFLTIEPTT
jgi:hypothetical protein